MTVIPFPQPDDRRESPAGVSDAGARQMIREDLEATLVVEAAAGTGKTTELVNRILAVLASGRAEMNGIVAVTFTEKAAGELKLRLRERLEHDRANAADPVVSGRLDEALKTLEEAHVNTIHGFCAELLRERPVEALVDPLFVVLTEPQAEALYRRAFSRWLEEALQQPPEAVRRALRRISAPAFGGQADGPVDRLRNAGRALAEARDFTTPWRRPPFDRSAEIDRLVAALHELATLSASTSSMRDNLHFDLDAVRRLSRQIQLEQKFGYRDLDGWEARLVDLVRDRGFSRTRKGSGYRYGTLDGRDVTRTEVIKARDALFEQLQLFKREADADLAAGLQQELAGATQAYQELKKAAGALDFTDLLSLARDLIRRDRDVRAHLQRKCTRIFVDEFQDTDPIQAEILLLLASDNPDVVDAADVRPLPGKLFIVGDPKQAIYRFRGTDVGTYWRVSRQLESRGGVVVQLSTSYRSAPELQRFVNAAFADAMQGNDIALQADYIALAPGRSFESEQPTVVALPVPKPYSSRGALRVSAREIEQSTPQAVGAFIAWLVDPANGWTVSRPGPNGSEVREPIKPSDIAVLFRRFVSFGDDVTRAYTDAIEARGIQHLLVGGKSFHGREEVETIRAALAAVEWPDDELSVFATLKGALFAIDDELLLEWRHRFGAFHPFRIPAELGGNRGLELALTAEPTAHLVPIADSLRLLQELHRRRNYRPVADTVTHLLADTRAHVGLILRPAGEQALANVLHIAELARQYEAAGGISFRGFIDQLRDAAASEGAEAPILEESSDGVRLMTVHKAKGLEFPVVILADPTCRIARTDASRYLDLEHGLCAMRIGGWAPHELHEHEAIEVLRDEAEGVRLAYVAATRARDLLVVPAVGDEPWEGGWFSPLNKALYPAFAQRRQPTNAPMCPRFKSKDSVLERANGEPATASTVAPGLHRFDDGHRVVWWDPSVLDLERQPLFGVRRDDLIVKDVPKHVVADGRTRYDTWRLSRADAIERGAVPSITLATVREWTAVEGTVDPPEADSAKVEFVDLSSIRSVDAELGRGPMFGSLVHAVLARAPLDGADDDLHAIATIEARVLGADEALVGAVVQAVRRAVRHPLMMRASAAATRGQCRRETPVTCRLADGRLLEGVVDLAFEEEGIWQVVDFKTDVETRPERQAQYRRQAALYVMAIQQATGQRAVGTLLRI